MQVSVGAWITTIRAELRSAGRVGDYWHAGVLVEVEFVSSREGVVCYKGQEYPCRVKASPRMSSPALTVVEAETEEPEFPRAPGACCVSGHESGMGGGSEPRKRVRTRPPEPDGTASARPTFTFGLNAILIVGFIAQQQRKCL